MSFYKHLITLFICTSFIINAQQTATLTIKLQTVPLPDSLSVFITGNNEVIGNWDPSKIKLTKLGKSEYAIKLSVESGTRLDYKFTLGNWNNEALNEDGSVPRNYSVEVTQDTTVTNNVRIWANKKELSIVGQITGLTKYYRQIEGMGIKARDIIVWLPPGYNDNLNTRYPVLYMHDGGNIFDPKVSFTGIDWQIDECADSLIRKREIDSLIVVGIYNTSDRTNEYGPFPLAQKYMNYIINVIKPLIDKDFRTKPGREFTATGGSSMGGICAFQLAWQHNEVFSKAICMSSAFKVQGMNYVDTVLNYKGVKKDIKVYIDNGTIDLESLLLPGNYDMLDALKAKGYNEGIDYLWHKEDGATHNEAAWAKRFFRPLLFLFGKK